MSKNIKYQQMNKTFLSPMADEYSTIAWSVDICDEGPQYAYLNASVRMSDCSKNIMLDFDVRLYQNEHTSSEDIQDNIKKRIQKIDTLIEELKTFKSHFVKASKYKHNKSSNSTKAVQVLGKD